MSLADYPLAAFDIESTGPDPLTDRIVTATILEIHPTRGVEVHEWLLDPGIEISEGATKVHGISTEHARDHGRDYSGGLLEIAGELDRLWAAGYLVAVMNAPFDLTMIDRESQRVFGMPGRRVGSLIDPLVVDKHLDRYRKGGRTLTDLAKHYGVEQGEAHTSAGDCYTVARIAYKLVRSPKLAEVDDAETLQQLQRSWRAEQQDSLRAFWQGRGDERWRTVSSDWPVIA
ncbi:DnaQ-like DNA polymerase III subunit [Gordonia phage Twonlo]|nr:DnaQ-like DNA polymerase III subunit [Gordonia phage Dexdert]QDF19661.1 DnaQ-like DNA polymerase III subunit [Gordonia Terrae phage RoadKill]QOI66822.1 DnaQ-like DNA polymerase III subunit [Gordonia phage Twonlo]QWY80273.1 DnaQ-like DNA polymerase III subunit [Gordonia phage EdmundFerry]WNO27381.1 DnaQ-like DNA polymerase III subunit [Gordonia phage Kwekel]QPO17070.1 DnaQ-like DNA polymerase III subunit [Gordonia phage Dexdert]